MIALPTFNPPIHCTIDGVDVEFDGNLTDDELMVAKINYLSALDDEWGYSHTWLDLPPLHNAHVTCYETEFLSIPF